MSEILSLLSLAIALSMDTFSLSLGVGTFGLPNKKAIFLSIVVGCMHFIMPLIGLVVGNELIALFSLNAHFLVGIIFLFLAFEMVLELLKKEEQTIDLSIWGCLAFAVGVSLDSFSAGLGLTTLTRNYILALILFSTFSFLFTYLGLSIGKYTTKVLGYTARILGAVLLVILGLIYLWK